MKLKLNYAFQSHKSGDIINVADKDGIPVDKFWRKRLKEAEIDNCVEVVTSQPEAKKQEKKEEKKTEVVIPKKQEKDEVKDDNS